MRGAPIIALRVFIYGGQLMANRIKIRHGSGTPTNQQLLPYELGWNGTALYINNNKNDTNNATIAALPMSGGTLTGRLTAPGITINSTSGAAHLQFSRESWNYIVVPFANGGSFNLANSVASADIYYNFTSTGCLPGTTNTYTLGASNKLWKNIYATDFTGHLAGAADYIRVTDTTPSSDTYYYPIFSKEKTADSDYVARASNNFRYWMKSDNSINYLMLGNSITNGRLRLYDGTSGKYVNIYVNTTLTDNRGLYLPDVSGTLITTAGGTLTGQLIVNYTSTDSTLYPIRVQRNASGTSKAGVAIRVENSSSGIKTSLMIGSGGINHGLYSDGYWDGTDYTPNNSWIIYRDKDGNVQIPLPTVLNNATITGTLTLTKTTAATATAANAVALIVGGKQTGSHIEIDGNSILAKNTGTTAGTLYLQDSTGGTVRVAGDGGLYVDKGDITVSKSGESYVKVTNSKSSINVSALLDVGSTGNHGIWSTGYAGTSSGIWEILRYGETGIVRIRNNTGSPHAYSGLFITTSATVPTGARIGDIVLVKA